MEERLFVVRGGDRRNWYLAWLLKEEGYNAAVWDMADAPDGIPAVSDADVGTQPCVAYISLTAGQDEVSRVLKCLREGSVCFGGFASEGALGLARDKTIAYHNILEYEPFAVWNCIPTAEGALMLAIQNTPFTLHGSRAVILGYGRVGKAVAKLFASCCAETVVVCRSCEQLAYAKLYGHGCMHMSRLEEALSQADIVLNTIPAQVLNRRVLTAAKRSALIIELASGKSNIDYGAAAELGLRVVDGSASGQGCPAFGCQIYQGDDNALYERRGVTRVG